MKNKQLILATDLDGTFLAGSEQEKTQFYQLLSEQKNTISVIFVTGRTLNLVKELYTSGFNFIPDYIIADHGTIVVHGHNFEYVETLQAEIIKQWNQSKHDQLRQLLQTQAVEEQPFNPPYRHAYYYDNLRFNHDCVVDIEALGFECILSHDVFLDILPSGFNKGSTLQKLITGLKVSPEKILTCGDSLNDLPLFKTGYKSVAVGNAEASLVEKIQSMDNVFHSQHPGVLGIIDGLMNWSVF